MLLNVVLVCIGVARRCVPRLALRTMRCVGSLTMLHVLRCDAMCKCDIGAARIGKAEHIVHTA